MQQQNGCLALLAKWLITAVAVFAAAEFLPGIHVDRFADTLWVSLALGVINAVLKPILTIISIPFIVITFGLFLVVINAVALSVADSLVDGFEIDSFGWAMAGSLVISLVSYLLSFPGQQPQQ
jgi:putative membrane protein